MTKKNKIMDRKLTPDECEFEWRNNIGLAKVYLEDFVKALDLASKNKMKYKIETSICESHEGKPYYLIDLLKSNEVFYPNEWRVETSFTRFIDEHGDLSGDDLIVMFITHVIGLVRNHRIC